MLLTSRVSKVFCCRSSAANQRLVEQPGKTAFVNALDVEVRHSASGRRGDFSGKVFIGEKFQARASRRWVSACCKSASISSG